MKEFVIDFDRERRLGFPEVIYGGGKSADLLIDILAPYAEKGKNVLATRVDAEKSVAILSAYPGAVYDPKGRTLFLARPDLEGKVARTAIVSAGSSDLPAVYEARDTLALLGEASDVVADVGVAGIHRLFNRLDELRQYQVLIVVAGFEGALPSVIGGLLPQPIIAVPTSTGYGVAADGTAALHAMLTSCANGVTVVNIDNGYGAAMAAYRILKTSPSQ